MSSLGSALRLASRVRHGVDDEAVPRGLLPCLAEEVVILKLGRNDPAEGNRAAVLVPAVLCSEEGKGRFPAGMQFFDCNPEPIRHGARRPGQPFPHWHERPK